MLDLVFDWLLQASFRASALALVVLALQFLLRQHLDARWLHALWLPVLVILLMPALPESRWSAEHLILTAPSNLSVNPYETASAQLGDQASGQAGAAQTVIWPGWPSVVLGVALMLTLSGGSSYILTLRRIRRTAVPPTTELWGEVESLARELRLRQIPRLWQSAAVLSPAVAGVFRPVLLLPLDFTQRFTPSEATLILKHELTHLRRGDLLMNMLLCGLIALHWFNPLLWLAFHRARADREAACDADVLRSNGPDQRHSYGLALIKAQSASGMPGWNLGFVGMLAPVRSLHHRIQAIARPAHTHRAAACTVIVLLTALTCVIATKAEAVKAGEPLIGVQMQVLSEVDAADLFTDANSFRIVSADELARLCANSKGKMVSWPRLVTRNDQEAHMRSIVNTPVKDPTQSSGIFYVPIGFVAKLCPHLHDGRIQLSIEITDSKILEQQTMEGGDSPTIAKSWLRRSTLDLAPGETIACWNEEERTLRTFTASLVAASAMTPSALDRAQQFRVVQYDFHQCLARDVLRFLAKDSETLDDDKKGIRLSLPKSHEKKLVTFHLQTSLPDVLQEIASQLGCSLRADAETIFLEPK